MTRRPRVALSGSAGTGKSTLGAALAARLDVPYLHEGMRHRIEGGLDLHSLTHETLKLLVIELWAEQRAAEDAAIRDAGGFIADRSSVDFAAFWLHYHFGSDGPGTELFFAETLGRVPTYDNIVLLPWGVLPLMADGVRSTNRWTQRHYQATVEGLLFREVGPPRLRVLPPVVDLGARLDWVLEGITSARGR